MCHPKLVKNCPVPKYDDGGEVIEEDNNSLPIPEGVLQHIDTYICTSYGVHHGIFAFVYESNGEVIVMWTSEQVQRIYAFCKLFGIPMN